VGCVPAIAIAATELPGLPDACARLARKSALKCGGGRLEAIAALIAAFGSVILVAAISVLLIVGLWRLHACIPTSIFQVW
jgi:hypothetical protein